MNACISSNVACIAVFTCRFSPKCNCGGQKGGRIDLGAHVADAPSLSVSHDSTIPFTCRPRRPQTATNTATLDTPPTKIGGCAGGRWVRPPALLASSRLSGIDIALVVVLSPRQRSNCCGSYPCSCCSSSAPTHRAPAHSHLASLRARSGWRRPPRRRTSGWSCKSSVAKQVP